MRKCVVVIFIVPLLLKTYSFSNPEIESTQQAVNANMIGYDTQEQINIYSNDGFFDNGFTGE